MIKLSNTSCSVDIDETIGGRIAQIRIADLNLLVGHEANPFAWGSYPMVPWVGRLRNGQFEHQGKTYRFPLNMPPHAIHGTCFDRAWKIIEQSDTQVNLQIAFEKDWPFAGYSQQVISLSENSLNLQLSVHSETETFPASIGWHPWFVRQLARGKPAELHFKAQKKYQCDETQIPTGEFIAPGKGPWDDCFINVIGKPSITWAEALRLEIASTCDHWVVYDMPAHALCVEPQSAAANSLNASPLMVSPDNPLCAEMTLSWQLL